MPQNKYLYIFLILNFLLIGCSSLPPLTHYTPTKEIKTAYGPEDIVIDSISSTKTRLLISCCSRRKIEPDSLNGIYSLDLDSETVYELKRENEPDSIRFHPHGFDLAFINHQAYLYVINHEDDINRQSILKYKVLNDKLIFDSIIIHPLIHSPNDIFVYKDGSFFISNDAGKRGNRWEMIFKQKKGSVVFFPILGTPQIIDGEMGYPNGVYFDNKYLYVSTVSEENLYRYTFKDQKFSDKALLTQGIKGGDNLNPYKNGLIIPVHLNFWKFIRHAKNKKHHSPTVIYYYDITNDSLSVLYSNEGEQISAASTAIIYNNNLFISQIFDDFILKIELD